MSKRWPGAASANPYGTFVPANRSVEESVSLSGIEPAKYEPELLDPRQMKFRHVFTRSPANVE